MAPPIDLSETIETLLAEIPTELQDIINHMNDSGLIDIGAIDENLLSQIPSELIEIITRMNESGSADENRLSQIPESIISLITQMNESPRFNSAPPTPLSHPLTPLFEEETQYDVFEQLNKCLSNLEREGLDHNVQNESPRFNSAPPTPLSQPLTPMSEESETQYDVFEQLDDCLANQDGDGLDRSEHVLYRNKFHNIEVRQFFNFAWGGQIREYAVFYVMLMDTLNELVDRVRAYSQPRDTLQLEILGDSLQSRVSLILNRGEADLEQFVNLLERLVQSNLNVLADRTLELVVQLVRPPQGGGGQRRKLDSLMQSEIISNKKAYLIIVHNHGNKLCFAIGLDHLLSPGCTEREALQKAQELQKAVGLAGLMTRS
ncbi:uncharacterized protein LOC129818293 [Salvelinus fontinalis]|uniref:uncharacterized protein LOC129818293 n=1 Tax=Salvelinus fontinalis TaxID=8038 RepID=UPI002486A4D7|nr:uncharacterized protein LOC129818293 [Salvelinus fontinalis]